MTKRTNSNQRILTKNLFRLIRCEAIYLGRNNLQYTQSKRERETQTPTRNLKYVLDGMKSSKTLRKQDLPQSLSLSL